MGPSSITRVDETALIDPTAPIVAIKGWNRLALVTKGSGPMITLKRAYDPISRADGTRFLVERLWPRGLSKTKLHLDAWLKDVGPSTELRKWFGHDPDKWDEFRKRYRRELDSRPDAWQSIVSAARHRPVTLVYSSHDTEHNNAVALQEYLEAKMHHSSRATAADPPRRRPKR